MSQQFSTIGQIATDPKLFTPAGGAEFCTFRLASGERRYDAAKQEWVDTDTNWFTVNTFRSLARHAQRALRKGDRVVVSGKLRVRQWVNEEKRGTAVEIDADGIGHDLRFGVSVFTKTIIAEPKDTSGQDAGSTPEQAQRNAGATQTEHSGASSASGTSDEQGSPGAATEPASDADATAQATAPTQGDDLSSDGFTPKLASV